jgi:histidyl-tRNA synthetase
MQIQPLRGFHDFYPQDQSKINFLRQTIAETCSLFGYEEFEGPALEAYELYAAKSSDEIVSEQAFSFADRGGERVVLRPELTPTLARMVAVKQNQLIFPLRWWSFGRFWRYERPQKGRGREFHQWNCDLIGDESINAEGEVIEIIINFLSRLGLKPDEVMIEINDRDFIGNYLNEFDSEDRKKLFKVLDKSDSLSEEELTKYIAEQEFKNPFVIEEIKKISKENLNESPKIKELLFTLKEKGLDQWVETNPRIARGFEYYTGIVFEVRDRNKQFRSILGGGRYNNLVADVGGQSVSGIGFGMGDMVLLELLEEKGLIKPYKHPAKAVTLDLDNSPQALAFTTELRQENIPTVLFSGSNALTQGLRFANRHSIPYALLIGVDEIKSARVTFKTLATGDQESLSLAEAMQKLK